MDSIALLLEEYKFIGEKYFDRMYSILNFTILFYGTILTIVYGMERPAPESLVFLYLLPVSTYIFGLFYAYNSFAITKQGYHMIRIENLIKKYSNLENGQKSFIGWNILAKTKKNNGNYILAYGTSLMLYILTPIFDYVLGISYNGYKIIWLYTNNMCLNYAISLLPIVFYIIYMIFMILIISKIFDMHSRITKYLKKMKRS